MALVLIEIMVHDEGLDYLLLLQLGLCLSFLRVEAQKLLRPWLLPLFWSFSHQREQIWQILPKT